MYVDFMNGRLQNAFTCTGAYALLIMTGIKRVENRAAVPFPAVGRCAVSVSKKFCEREYWNLVAWVKSNLGAEGVAALPPWEIACKWPGHIIGTIDYAVKSAAECSQEELLERQFWNEGYGCWWHLANPLLLSKPIPCRGNVGMWRLPEELSERLIAISPEKPLNVT